MQCIEELHEQLGQPVLDAVAALRVAPAQLKALHARMGHLQASAQAVQDYPLFQPVTALLNRQCSGSNTSRSDGSSQVQCRHLMPCNVCVPHPRSAAIKGWHSRQQSTETVAPLGGAGLGLATG